MRPYLKVGKISLCNELAYPQALLWSGIFFVVLLSVFVRLWQQVYPTFAAHEWRFSFATLIGYFVLSQVILSSLISKSQEIMEEVKNGSLAHRLRLPIHYISFHLADALGKWLWTLAYFTLLGTFFLLATQCLPDLSLFHLVTIGIAILLGTLIDFFINVCMGLFAFWFEDSYAVIWLYHKLLVFAGGAMAPLDIFPDWLRSLASFLPFSYIIYHPAMLVTATSNEHFLHVAMVQLGWIVFTAACAHLCFVAAKKKVSIQGG